MDHIVIGLIGVSVAGFLGIIIVDFCDRKLPKMLGLKNESD